MGFTGGGRALPHFDGLVNCIEDLFVTGKPGYPVERTLLTSGVLAFAFDSREQKKRVDTPNLSIRYRTPKSVFLQRSYSGTWNRTIRLWSVPKGVQLHEKLCVRRQSRWVRRSAFVGCRSSRACEQSCFNPLARLADRETDRSAAELCSACGRIVAHLGDRMGFTLWIDDGVAWAQGTHEYKPMGVAAILATDLFRHRDFNPARRFPAMPHGLHAGLFASVVDLNAWLKRRRRFHRP
jgi:hypothetical protein